MPNKHDGEQPASQIFAITPNDSTDFARTRGLSITVAGILRMIDAEGNEVTLASGALAAGVIHPISVTRVYSTTTTATGIWGYR